ncbi:MAG: glycosyltransferase family 39 protein, partial [Acidobacteriota bacterium]|nr:glycosyltransferase family 39 protein [Acidobacteriota bacterium]
MVIAAHRPFWFDEVVTALFGRLPTLRAVWSAAGRVDAWGMPAPYYFLVHAFVSWFGPPEISTRLPSALAVAAGLWLTFDCARRLTDGLHGLVATALLTCSFLPYYGFEARSYGIFFLLASLSLWVWAHTGWPRQRTALIFFALFLTGVLMHPYFVLCLVPYAAWDLSEWRSGWRPRPAIVAGTLG